jgi:integrase
MKQRYRLFRRGWGTWYCEDTQTGKQETLGTRIRQEAQRIIHAKNEAHQQPLINRQIARAYLQASDPAALTRTWQFVMDEMGRHKKGPTKERWIRAMAEKPFDQIRNLALVETRAEHLLDTLARGKVSTNIFLRRLHNYALDFNWLLAPILPRRPWPKIKFGEKRAITLEEHQKVLASERNLELRDYYEVLWHLGGSQTDIAMLCAQDIDSTARTASYGRLKSGSPALIHLGDTVMKILERRPASGHLFPMLAGWKESDRGKAFIRRCKLAGVSGVSLHSYRYAWAERAMTVGYPERFAQEALGHKSKAVHRAYAKKAQVKIPSLEQYEQAAAASQVIPMPVAAAANLNIQSGS